MFPADGFRAPKSEVLLIQVPAQARGEAGVGLGGVGERGFPKEPSGTPQKNREEPYSSICRDEELSFLFSPCWCLKGIDFSRLLRFPICSRGFKQMEDRFMWHYGT